MPHDCPTQRVRTRIRDACYQLMPAAVFAATAATVTFHYDLYAAWPPATGIAVGLLLSPFFRAGVPAPTTNRARRGALDRLAEQAAVGGLALAGVIACLTTDLFKTLEGDHSRAITCLVVVCAFCLYTCRAAAREAAAGLSEHDEDVPRRVQHETRLSRAFAETALGTLLFTGFLLASAVW